MLGTVARRMPAVGRPNREKHTPKYRANHIHPIAWQKNIPQNTPTDAFFSVGDTEGSNPDHGSHRTSQSGYLLSFHQDPPTPSSPSTLRSCNRIPLRRILTARGWQCGMGDPADSHDTISTARVLPILTARQRVRLMRARGPGGGDRYPLTIFDTLRNLRGIDNATPFTNWSGDNFPENSMYLREM